MGEEQRGPTPGMPSKRLRELTAELGYAGGKTIFDDYMRELRPRFLRRRTYQRKRFARSKLERADVPDALAAEVGLHRRLPAGQRVDR